MDLERAAKVAAAIRHESGKHHEQTTWFRNATDHPSGRLKAKSLLAYDCGTTACVAGWSAALAYPEGLFLGMSDICPVPDSPVRLDLMKVAQLYLDISWDEGIWLFGAYRTRDEILAVLDTGEFPYGI